MAELNPEALEAHNPFQGPVPGQSLTNSPDAKQAWEQPPKITNVTEGRETMFLEILKKENLEQVVMLMNEGMSVGELAEMLLFIGYSKGQFNADMMMLLAEPTMYMLLAIAETVGIDPKINKDDGEDPEDLDEDDDADIERLTSQMQSKMDGPNNIKELQKNLSASAIPKEILDKVAETDFSQIKESLMSKQEGQQEEPQQAEAEAEAPQQNNSLLQRTV